MADILNTIQQEYLNSFRKEADPLISEMENYAAEYNVPILTSDSADFLEQLIRIANPKRVLEIGTAIGYSSIRIARNLRKKGEIHTIEKSEDNINVAKSFFEKSGFSDKIILLEGDAFKQMPQLGKKYDFIFLDADKEDYNRLFDYSMVLLKKGGIIFIDNLLWHGYAAVKRTPQKYKVSAEHIREFNKLFMSQPNLKTTILPVGDGIGLGIKI